MRIEPATSDDVDVLVDQWVALAEEQRSHGTYILAEDNREQIRKEFLRGAVTGTLLVAREDGPPDGDEGYPGAADGVAGFVSFATTTGGFAEAVDRGVVSNVYVRPDRRGEGVGSDLLAAAERRLAEEGASVVTLEAMAENERAIAFYRDRGYTPHRVELSKSLEEDD